VISACIDAFVTGAFHCQFTSFLDKFPPLLPAFAVTLPVREATEAPIGEIGFCDWTASETVGENFLDFRQAVKPRQEFISGHAVFEFLVELIADALRQAGDFSGSCFHRLFFNRRWTQINADREKTEGTQRTRICGSVSDLSFSSFIWSGFTTNGVCGKTHGDVLLGSDWG
jgi:hypothetical protein